VFGLKVRELGPAKGLGVLAVAGILGVLQTSVSRIKCESPDCGPVGSTELIVPLATVFLQSLGASQSLTPLPLCLFSSFSFFWLCCRDLSLFVTVICAVC
jgi:hypothetical protein